MKRERDILVKEVFPALRAKFRARGVEVFEVDLRWGINREQSERGETLPTLLAEIDRCRPHFIGLIGDRYGWVPPAAALTQELKASYPSIADAAGTSVTELEIIHGVLRSPEAVERALFFERAAGWDWKTTLSGEDLAVISAETDNHRARLSKLKASIRASGAHVERYSSPAEIGDIVLKTLGATLDARFPEAQAHDAFEHTTRLHRAYARERRGLSIGAAAYCAALDRWMTVAQAPPMLITGASGGGKSMLIANWVEAHRKSHPKDAIFEHYLGASPDSADPVLLMRRIWEHLDRATGEIVEAPPNTAGVMDVSAGLAGRLARARAVVESRGGRILIALDGLDKLSREQNLRWLPRDPRIKLLASALDGEAKSTALSHGWTALEVRPLNDAEADEFIGRTLEGWGRKLLDQQVAQIRAHRLAGLPLFLHTVLNELRVSATDALLAQRLEHYLGVTDMPALFARMLERFEEDLGGALVSKAASLIWASRAGLEEADVIALTRAKPLEWATLRNGLGDALRNQDGRVTFGHDFLRNAVAMRYLYEPDLQHAAHLDLANHLEGRPPGARQAEELPFQLRTAEAWQRLETLLIDLDRFELLRNCGDGEMLSNWLPLQERGRDPGALLCAAFEARAGIEALWTPADIKFAASLGGFLRFAGSRGLSVQKLEERRTAACQRVLGPKHAETLTSMNDLALCYYDRGDFDEALKLQERVLKARTQLEGAEHPRTLSSMTNLALTLDAKGDYKGAQKLQEHVLAARMRTLGAEHPATLTSMNNLATTLRNRGDLQGALKWDERVVEAMTRLLGPEHPSALTSISNLASTLHRSGDLRGAKKMFERVLETSTRLLGVDHVDTLNAMNNLGATLYASGDREGAQKLQERVMESMTRLLGAEHADTLSSMYNLGSTLYARGDRNGARQLFERVLDARTRLLGAEHPKTLECMSNVAVILADSGDLEGAEKLQEHVLKAMTLSGAKHPDIEIFARNLSKTRTAIAKRKTH